jgi:hypothetical protein
MNASQTLFPRAYSRGTRIRAVLRVIRMEIKSEMQWKSPSSTFKKWALFPPAI